MSGRLPPRVSGELRAQSGFFTRRVAGPARQFIHTEGASGRLLLAAASIAMVWANSPWGGAYERLWDHHIVLDLGFVQVDENLRHWVNDGLMAVFFFLVTLEVKRELTRGELSSRQKASLPVAAALGGMVVPAAIYFVVNAGTEFSHGWGIPMATDIAFAVGALALLGRGAPPALLTFLLALAVVDDIGAIAVIAIFYSDSINLGALGIAGLLVATVIGAQRMGIRAIPAYLFIGFALWLAVLESGIHATIAGVALGALTPAHPRLDIRDFYESALPLIRRIEERSEIHDPDAESALGEIEGLVRETESPLERLEHAIHPWSGYVVLPVFALANAGVPLDTDAISNAMGSAVTHGVLLGLLIGKPVGILLASWIAVRLGVASLPSGVSWVQVAAVGALAGIGFTVSLFVTDLAFDSAAAVEEAKIGIVAATIAAALCAWPLLHLSLRGPTRAS